MLLVLFKRVIFATAQLQDLDIRTEQIEVDRLAALSGRLEEYASMNEDVEAKLVTLEQCSLKEHAGLSSRLDNCSYDLEQTRVILDGLARTATRDFIESPNSQFRLYVTPDGDVAVYQRNNWGKFADSDFQGIPCWHAGSQTLGDRPLCSVNREMQAHEKDRFLALANRSAMS